MNRENSKEASNNPPAEEEKVDKSLRRMKAIKKTPADSSPTGSLKSDSEDED